MLDDNGLHVPDSLPDSDDEIRMMYREAKNKTEQIGILADLNLCGKDEIRQVLGLKKPGRGKSEEAPEPSRKELPEAIQRLVKARLKDLDIAILKLEEEVRKLIDERDELVDAMGDER